MAAPQLERLLAPVTLEAFLARYWEREVLYLKRGDAHYYDALLTLRDLEKIVSTGGLRYPALQLSIGGAFLPPEAFCKDVRSGEIVFSGVPDLDRLQSAFQSGATLSLPGLHRAWRPLAELAGEVESYLNHGVHTNIYLTPRSSQGFDPHYDTHEVFVLQISGRKHWKIFDSLVQLPHQTQPFHPSMYNSSTPVRELDLEPGDLLYVPRGVVHTTHSLDEASAHVTLGISIYTYIEMLTIWLQGLRNHPGARAGLPSGFLNSAAVKPVLARDFAELLARLAQSLDADRLVDAFLDRVRTGYPGKLNLDAAFHANPAIGLESRLRTLDSSHYALGEEGEDLMLRFSGKTAKIPAIARGFILEACARPSFRLCDLPCDLDDIARLALARRLYEEGFLLPV
ncbi:MAG: cupin domain-containing protein [Methylocystis sp.]